MWLEVNVRLSEVTDLKWPHGTECQCGNSTLAMSWPNHAQLLSFASMASRQGAVKHGFVSKIAGGCSSYDVIAPWPALTWSFFFYQKLRKVYPIRYPKTRRRCRFLLSAKNLRGVAPPCPGGIFPNSITRVVPASGWLSDWLTLANQRRKTHWLSRTGERYVQLLAVSRARRTW